MQRRDDRCYPFNILSDAVYDKLKKYFPNVVNRKCDLRLAIARIACESSVEEYLTAKVAEIAAKKAKERGSDTVTLEDLVFVIDDPELKKFYQTLE
ncbi:hypothetical protein AVEN_108568-1 [Araneus ventricosus]|uniref:Uncharacterized protein n=1 Tax=Araneus ventricosus TaxID=182803 RepID=A0A4Y2DIC7_ARAVE|nr:hypothetical protein AVEN_108568-1 [Araneus ventricosus]